MLEDFPVGLKSYSGQDTELSPKDQSSQDTPAVQAPGDTALATPVRQQGPAQREIEDLWRGPIRTPSKRGPWRSLCGCWLDPRFLHSGENWPRRTYKSLRDKEFAKGSRSHLQTAPGRVSELADLGWHWLPTLTKSHTYRHHSDLRSDDSTISC